MGEIVLLLKKKSKERRSCFEIPFQEPFENEFPSSLN